MKKWYKKEWLWLLIANIFVAIATQIIENQQNLDLNARVVQILMASLTAVRFITKTAQDKELIKKSGPIS